jgi:kynurenine formamidase
MHPAIPVLLAFAALPGMLSGCRAREEALPEGDRVSGGMVLDESHLLDLTYAFDSTAVYWPTEKSFRLERTAYGSTPNGTFYAANRFRAAEHGGTHLDAPIHFAEGGWTVGEIPLQQLVGPAAVIDVSDSVEWNPDYRLTEKDLLEWEKRNGPVPGGAIVLLRTGWSKNWPDPKKYFGSETPEDTETLHFPGFSEEAARFLIQERFVDAVGLDTPSLDAGQAVDFPAHRAFAASNVPGFENVANLRHLPETGAWVMALPMKIADGTGAPLRIVALLPPAPAAPPSGGR